MSGRRSGPAGGGDRRPGGPGQGAAGRGEWSGSDRRPGGGGRTGGRPGGGGGGDRRSGPGGRPGPGVGGAERRPGGPARGEGRPDRSRDRERPTAGPQKWGGLARRGAGRLTSGGASDAWRAAVGESRGRDTEPEARGDETAPRWQPEEWIDEGVLRDEAAEAVGRGGRPGRARRRPDEERSRAGEDEDHDDVGAGPTGRETDMGDDLRTAFGSPARAARAESRLREASDAFRHERFEEARRTLRPLAEQGPGVAAVRELYGLTLYRLGRWAQALRELEAFRTLTGSTDQHPVLADCNRALGRYGEVEELWDELRAASPSAELVAEGRIVAAGALADQGRLDEAIGLLNAGVRPTKRPRAHHLRMAYALADLYERAGDLPRARDLFRRVADADPDFVDVRGRVRALG